MAAPLLRYIGTPEYFDGIYFLPGFKYRAWIDRFYTSNTDLQYVVKIYRKSDGVYICIPYSCNPIGRYWEYC